jgi:uncharacterized protein (TIGR03437 family)
MVLITIALVYVQRSALDVQDSKPGIPSKAAASRAIDSLGHLPLRFEANLGQTDSKVKFLSRGSGYSLFLTSNEAVLTLNSGRENSSLAVDRMRKVIQNNLYEKLHNLAPLQAGSVLARRSTLLTASSLSKGDSDAPSATSEKSLDGKSEERATLRMKLVRANPLPEIIGLNELPGKSNYFIGNDPALWRRQVSTYAKVRYRRVYPGIDLIYYGNPNQLEYDFVLAPGANLDAIRLDIQGTDKLGVDERGNLVLSISGRQIRWQTPAIYQEAEGKRREIAGHYVLRGDHQVGFQVAAYDSSKPLTIDPVLIYSTYLGGSSDENSPATQFAQAYGVSGAAVAVDASGNAYLSGYTTSVDFPLQNAAEGTPQGASADAFVAEIDPTGSKLLYSTYLGGINGDQDGMGIAVDSSGNAYVTGFTSSPNFPTTPGAYRVAPYDAITRNGSTNAFVTKINANGSIGYSTYLGGNVGDIAFAIAVDSGGNAYVAGYTSSTNFPTAHAYQGSLRNSSSQTNAFVTKFNSAGSALVYSTYLGGNYTDYATGIALDTSGNAYVTGQTASTNFPVSNGAIGPRCGSDGNCNSHTAGGPYFESFVTKVNTTGSGLAYSTYLGGSFQDNAAGIAVDSTGNAYVVGSTTSPDFPTTSGSLQTTFHSNQSVPEGFVTKINPVGTQVVYSTYLGGSGSDSEIAVAVDSSGNAYVAGSTTSPNFPLAGQPFQPFYAGQGDATVAELDPKGATLIYSSYIGGSQADLALGIAVDASGSAYVTGVTGSADFPTANPFQANFSGTSDAFLVKIRGSAAGGPSIPANAVVNGASFAFSVALSPGSIASVFGTGLASSTPNGTVLTMNGIKAPLYYVGAGQINFQVPWELAGQSQANLVVTADGIPSNPVTVDLANFGPGIFTLARTDGSTNQGAVLISNSNVLAAPVGSIAGATSRPANRGEFITIFCTGLGAVSNQPPTGVPASANPLSNTSTIPVATITLPGAVSFSGLAPGFFGLYQIDVQIPQNALTGLVNLQIQIGGQSSNIVTIAVQ